MSPDDKATEIEERDRAIAIARREPEPPPPEGKCAWCGEPLDDRRYCDAACRRDHELAQWQERQRKRI